MAISTLDLMPLVAAILHVISFDLLGGFIWRVCWPLIYRTIYSSWKLESSALMRIWFESSALVRIASYIDTAWLRDCMGHSKN